MVFLLGDVTTSALYPSRFEHFQDDPSPIPFESPRRTGYDGVDDLCPRPDEARAVDPEIARFVTYACPRCDEMLESLTDDWRDWLKCPSCGKAGRPPIDRQMQDAIHEDILYIGTFAAGPGSSNGHGAVAGYPHRGRSTNHTKRVILGGGFFLSVVLTLVSVVQQNAGQAGILGLVALFLLILLARSSGRA